MSKSSNQMQSLIESKRLAKVTYLKYNENVSDLPLLCSIVQKMSVCSYRHPTTSNQTLGESDTILQPSQHGLSALTYQAYWFEKLDRRLQRSHQCHATKQLTNVEV